MKTFRFLSNCNILCAKINNYFGMSKNSNTIVTKNISLLSKFFYYICSAVYCYFCGLMQLMGKLTRY